MGDGVAEDDMAGWEGVRDERRRTREKRGREREKGDGDGISRLRETSSFWGGP